MPRRERRAPEPWEQRADESGVVPEPSAAPPRRRGKPRGRGDEEEQRKRESSEIPAKTIPEAVLAVEGEIENFAAAAAVQQRNEEQPSARSESPAREQTRSELASEAFGHDSIRKAYEDLGAEAFYAAKGASYVNPHNEVLNEAFACALDAWSDQGWIPGLRSLDSVLDLACGSGEATAALESWLENRGADAPSRMEACDPYTFEAFERRYPGRACFRWTFEEIAGGCLESAKYDLVICSFALHLLDRSWLAVTLQALARQALYLVVATPHKRPMIDAQMGWNLCDEILHERVRLRLYSSLLLEERTET